MYGTVFQAGFRGTYRYVSARVHNKEEQCPLDDIVRYRSLID